MSAEPDQKRLETIYENLRRQLLDLSRRNQLLNYSLTGRSKRYVQIFDVPLQGVHDALVDADKTLTIAPLPDLPDVPLEEQTEEFVAAFVRGKLTDPAYLNRIEELDTEGAEDEKLYLEVEQELRLRIRDQLGLKPRAKKKDIERAEHARNNGINPSADLKIEGDGFDVLQTMRFVEELEPLLNKLLQDSKLAEQEMGLSTLYLAIGFLEWYESDSSDKKSYAPLLLLPVSLRKRTVHGRNVFDVSLREGEAETNLSLSKLLEENYSGRQLPKYEDEDEAGIAIAEYFARVEKCIDGLKRWCLHPWVVIGHFAFGRFAMYSDLEIENWGSVGQHSIVGALLHGAEKDRDPNAALNVPADYEIDNPEVERIAPLLIQDADASQHSALIDVMKGNNLVIQGPPGTGKSQTITNIIANALWAGKKVLFLAEKRAALEVVKRRLDRAGLGDFCLELHSDRSAPKNVIEALKTRVEKGIGRQETSFQVRVKPDPDWIEARDQISAYVSALHDGSYGSETPFSAIWQTIRQTSKLAELKSFINEVRLPERILGPDTDRDELLRSVERFAELAKQFESTHGSYADSPWVSRDVRLRSPSEAQRFLIAIKQYQDALSEKIHLFDTMPDLHQCNHRQLERLITDLLARPVSPRSKDFIIVDQVGTNLIPRLAAGLRELSSLMNEIALDPQTSTLSSALLEQARAASRDKVLQAHNADSYGIIKSKLAAQIQELQSSLLELRSLLQISTAVCPSIMPSIVDAVSILHAIKMMSSFTDDELSSISRFEPVDEAYIKTCEESANAISVEKTHWQKKLGVDRSGDGEAISKVENVLKIRSGSTLEKLKCRLTGRFASAERAIEDIGFRKDTSSDELKAFISFTHSIQSFVGDEKAQNVFGSEWKDLQTNFQKIKTAKSKAHQIKAELSKSPNAEKIYEVLILKRPSEMRALNTFDLPMPQHENGWVSGGLAPEINKIESELRQYEIAISQVNDDLMATGVSPKRALKAFELRQSADRLGEKNSELMRDFPHIHVDLDDLPHLEACVDWIFSVSALPISNDQKKRLASRNGLDAAQALLVGLKAICANSDNLRTLQGNLVSVGLADLDVLPDDEKDNYLAAVLGDQESLIDFIVLKEQRAALEEQSLSRVLIRFEETGADYNLLPEVFDTILAKARAEYAIASETLSKFNGAKLDRYRQLFVERDKDKLVRDRKTISSRLLVKVPPTGSQSGPRREWTDMGLLANEFSKSKRFLPVRQLMGRAGNAVLELTPCIMMSPLSLAKFLKPRGMEFDLLIIDEASQMKPEDALGGMLRASQIVVVGDPKQLPPTDFFSRAETTAEDDEDVEEIDAESILELCDATFGQRRQLKWHYRSQCESLIAFSNHAFYGDRLVTFPMSAPDSFSIGMHRVAGQFQARCNPLEAIAIAEAAFRFIRQQANLSADPLSLGIVALNLQQKELIQEELDRLIAGDALVEEYISRCADKGEDLFVKNLENVQGDERDVIFISMTYGKNPKTDVVAQNFGPINKKQGHRRLNVLFTRARTRIELFTSFGSSDVRVQETSSEGVRILKSYLEYAETRGRAFVQSIRGTPDSDFEIEVAERLVQRGFKLDFQVGVSGYKIDIGIRHPDNEDIFLAGVECDGATYHSSKSARDRDRLREEVLNRLGWNLVRVWSTDWFANSERETNKLVQKLNELKRSFDSGNSRKSKSLSKNENFLSKENVVPTEILNVDESNSTNIHIGAEESKIDNQVDQSHSLRNYGLQVRQDDFYKFSYRANLSKIIEGVLFMEAPIYPARLVSIVAQLHGFPSISSRRESIILNAISDAVIQKTESDGRLVFWHSETKYAEIISYREIASRNHADVPICELAGLALPFVKDNKITEAEIIQKMGEKFNLERVQQSTRSRFLQAIEWAKNNLPSN